jgi:dienelactone hydrolase
MLSSMGPFPQVPSELDARELGTLRRQGYRIEKLVFQSSTDVWVAANVYVPDRISGKLPAVLVVHGHWPLGRRDPVVQARCLGLVRLGFLVLAVDAFGAGERYTEPGVDTYHGALYGSALWPVGRTLLGMQVHDNRRAVDYLLTRPEVDGTRIGITGASGGGNQTMYAGALDERLRAVVPVCSVGNYQAYLRAACCVCEVLPGALRFTEEGDVLGMIAPRALLVINSSRDAVQFSPAEAAKSVARARLVFHLFHAEGKLRHDVFEFGHGYHLPMREAMYGWMRHWLMDEADARPVPEPALAIEKPEVLRCYPDGHRPKGFLFPPTFAFQEGRNLLAKLTARAPDHVEDWESTAVHMRSRLSDHLAVDDPKHRPSAEVGKPEWTGATLTTPLLFHAGAVLPVFACLKTRGSSTQPRSACVLLHLDGKAEALRHPLAEALLDKGWSILALDSRATGQTKPSHDAIKDAVDHNSAEHAVWIGQPLLGQWIIDIRMAVDWLTLQPGLRVSVVGLGHAGVVALLAAALLEDRLASAAVLDVPVTYVTKEAYGPKMRMGLLAPGILRIADIPQIASLVGPRRLIIAGGVSPQDASLKSDDLQAAFAFTRKIYGLYRAETKLSIAAHVTPNAIAENCWIP